MSNKPAPNKHGRKRTQIGDCDFEGCDKPKFSKGLCGGHYSQQARGIELRTLRAQTGGRKKGAKPKPTHKWESVNYNVESKAEAPNHVCLLYTSPSPRDRTRSRMPSSA